MDAEWTLGPHGEPGYGADDSTAHRGPGLPIPQPQHPSSALAHQLQRQLYRRHQQHLAVQAHLPYLPDGMGRPPVRGSLSFSAFDPYQAPKHLQDAIIEFNNDLPACDPQVPSGDGDFPNLMDLVEDSCSSASLGRSSSGAPHSFSTTGESLQQYACPSLTRNNSAQSHESRASYNSAMDLDDYSATSADDLSPFPEDPWTMSSLGTSSSEGMLSYGGRPAGVGHSLGGRTDNSFYGLDQRAVGRWDQLPSPTSTCSLAPIEGSPDSFGRARGMPMAGLQPWGFVRHQPPRTRISCRRSRPIPTRRSVTSSTMLPSPNEVQEDHYYDDWQAQLEQGNLGAGGFDDPFAPRTLHGGLEDYLGTDSLVSNITPAGPPEVSTGPWEGLSNSPTARLPDISWLAGNPSLPWNAPQVCVSPPTPAPTMQPATCHNVSSFAPVSPGFGSSLSSVSHPGRQHSNSDPMLPLFRARGEPSAPSLELMKRSQSSNSAPGPKAMTIQTKNTKMTKAAAKRAAASQMPTGIASTLAFGSTPRGKRSQKLKQDVKDRARQTRASKSVCIHCKSAKRTCLRLVDRDTDSPCIACLKVALTSPWSGICTKAHFFSFVEVGTCNYISQLAINHPIPGTKERLRINLSQVFDLDELLGAIGRAKDQFDIRVEQGGRALYVMDLQECFKYLTNVRTQLRVGKHDLRAFIDRDILRYNEWHDCIKECNPRVDQLGLLATWNNMPSRATYSYVWKEGDASGGRVERAMDPRGDDRDNVLLAAQLSRILCRKLEVEAYQGLQRDFNNFTESSIDFLHKLGRVLVTLRWRVSWWMTLGGGGTSGAQSSSADPIDPAGARDDSASAARAAKEKQDFEDRVQALCRVLYFYYCSMLRKLPRLNGEEMVQRLGGVHSQYADTATTVWDDFPQIESIDGFHMWMRRGEELIEKAGVRRRLRFIHEEAQT